MERTIPVSKHSHSGTISSRRITAAKASTFSTGLSNSMGGQAQSLLLRSFR